MHVYTCVYVCTCVCVHEKERKGKIKGDSDRLKQKDIFKYLGELLIPPSLFLTPITPNSVKRSEVREISHQGPLRRAGDVSKLR